MIFSLNSRGLLRLMEHSKPVWMYQQFSPAGLDRLVSHLSPLNAITKIRPSVCPKKGISLPTKQHQALPDGTFRLTTLLDRPVNLNSPTQLHGSQVLLKLSTTKPFCPPTGSFWTNVKRATIASSTICRTTNCWPSNWTLISMSSIWQVGRSWLMTHLTLPVPNDWDTMWSLTCWSIWNTKWSMYRGPRLSVVLTWLTDCFLAVRNTNDLRSVKLVALY